MIRQSFCLALALLSSLLPRGAAADETKRRCMAAFEDGQRFEREQDLTGAAEQLGYCSADPCPGAMHQECGRLLTEVQAATPGVVFSVQIPAGTAASSVRISIDGGEARPYSGEVLRLNPGKHQFAFGCDGCRSTLRRILFTDATVKRKEISLHASCSDPDASAGTCRATDAAPTSASDVPRAAVKARVPARPPSPAPQKGGESAPFPRNALIASTAALTMLGGVGFLGFGLQARRGDRNLGSCAPACSPDQVAGVKRDYFWANTALGTGIIALIGTGLLWATSVPPESSAHRAGPKRDNWAVHFGPITTLTATF